VSSPLDANEVEALMRAIQDGRVIPDQGEASGTKGPVVPYDLTSQDRIIRGQMPTLDAINDRIASLFGRSLSGRLRLEARVISGAATLLKFTDVQGLLAPPTTVGILSLGGGAGLAAVLLEGDLAQALLAGALGDRKARPDNSRQGATERADLTTIERLVLRHLLGLMADAMATAWADVLAFRPEVLRFESDARMASIAPASDVAIVCPFEVTGTMNGRLQLVMPYAAVEPAKKLLSSPPRLGSAGGDGDARFSAALARELEEVEVNLLVEIGRRTVNLSELLGLEVGDVLTLNTSENTPLPIFVEGRLKATGMPRVVNGSLAVAIERPVNPASGRADGPLPRPGGPGSSPATPYRPAA
jgi:flagellar motor switch protein FliM